jgi:hypothetical protein
VPAACDPPPSPTLAATVLPTAITAAKAAITDPVFLRDQVLNGLRIMRAHFRVNRPVLT